jgi:hypothetical protein
MKRKGRTMIIKKIPCETLRFHGVTLRNNLRNYAKYHKINRNETLRKNHDY